MQMQHVQLDYCHWVNHNSKRTGEDEVSIKTVNVTLLTTTNLRGWKCLLMSTINPLHANRGASSMVSLVSVVRTENYWLMVLPWTNPKGTETEVNRLRVNRGVQRIIQFLRLSATLSSFSSWTFWNQIYQFIFGSTYFQLTSMLPKSGSDPLKLANCNNVSIAFDTP